MAFLDDFASALETYPVDHCTLSITNVALEDGTAGSVNVDEVWKFKVKVENAGDLNMNNVEVHVLGQNGTTISTTGPAGPFESGFQTFGSLTVIAGGSQKTDFLYFKAPSSPQGAGTDLVLAHINDWDADLAPMLANNAGHTVGGGASAVYEAEVFP
jgi:hypothetical protein